MPRPWGGRRLRRRWDSHGGRLQRRTAGRLTFDTTAEGGEGGPVDVDSGGWLIWGRGYMGWGLGAGRKGPRAVKTGRACWQGNAHWGNLGGACRNRAADAAKTAHFNADTHGVGAPGCGCLQRYTYSCAPGQDGGASGLTCRRAYFDATGSEGRGRHGTGSGDRGVLQGTATLGRGWGRGAFGGGMRRVAGAGI